MTLTPAEKLYRRRLQVAAATSLLLHILVIFALIVNPGACHDNSLGMAAKPEPVVLTLQPRDPEPKHLIDTLTSTQEIVAPTDLIAETDSKAQDMVDSEGDRHRPHMEEIADFDHLGGLAAVVPPVTPVDPMAPSEPSPDKTDPPVEAKATVEPEAKPQPAPMTEPEPVTKNAETEPETQDPPSETEAAEAAPMQMARAEIPPLPSMNEGRPRARRPGGVETEGIANFEANQHELAPYLKQIRDRVEREWRAALQMRYTGTTPTRAVIECAINPNGELVDVRIVEPGNSVSYGPICKDAILRAGPFGKFPFEVPDIYKNENLQIRWSFSFM
jgi:outer membrane biosynthesis protein TonB